MFSVNVIPHFFGGLRVLLLLFFNWRVIALQCFGSCHTTVQISRNCKYTPSLLSLSVLFYLTLLFLI